MTTSEKRACELVASALKLQDAVSVGDGMDTLAAWDSLAHMAIVLELEAEIGRSLKAEEIASITSVGSVAGLLDEAAGGRLTGAG